MACRAASLSPLHRLIRQAHPHPCSLMLCQNPLPIAFWFLGLGLGFIFFGFECSANGISRVICLLTYTVTFLTTCTWAFRKPGAEPRPSKHQSLSTGSILCPSYVLSENIAYEISLCKYSRILWMAFFFFLFRIYFNTHSL